VPVAALALVFLFAMLSQLMSAGAMGAGQADKAAALAQHAVLIGAGAGLLYTAVFLLCGPVFYAWLGGRGEVLQGTGNKRVPSVTIVLGSGRWLAQRGTTPGAVFGPVAVAMDASPVGRLLIASRRGR
jgi:hypothetical protein